MLVSNVDAATLYAADGAQGNSVEPLHLGPGDWSRQYDHRADRVQRSLASRSTRARASLRHDVEFKIQQQRQHMMASSSLINKLTGTGVMVGRVRDG